MKLTNGVYYEIIGKKGMYNLHDRYETLDEALTALKKVTNRERQFGRKPWERFITKTMWNRTFEDDGTLVSESSGTVRLNFD